MGNEGLFAWSLGLTRDLRLEHFGFYCFDSDSVFKKSCKSPTLWKFNSKLLEFPLNPSFSDPGHDRNIKLMYAGRSTEENFSYFFTSWRRVWEIEIFFSAGEFWVSTTKASGCLAVASLSFSTKYACIYKKHTMVVSCEMECGAAWLLSLNRETLSQSLNMMSHRFHSSSS